MVNRLLPPVLTRRRIILACVVAVLTDAIQLAASFFGPPGWFFDGGIDLVAMMLQTLTLGFHPLFLPTFILKATPGVEMLPTWTGCTLFVIAVRRRQRPPAPVVSAAAPAASHEVIDV